MKHYMTRIYMYTPNLHTGHGPFSHCFDEFAPPGWCHEHASVSIFDYLIRANDLTPVLKSKGGLGEEEIHLVKQLILGDQAHAPADFTWNSPPPLKSFLYDIVANHRSGIDVDRMDYFQRVYIPLSIESTVQYGI